MLLVSLRYGLVVRIAGSHPAGPGSIPGNGKLFLASFGKFCVKVCVWCVLEQKCTTRMGFEPTRAEPIGLAVQRLNHSATSSWHKVKEIKTNLLALISPCRYVRERKMKRMNKDKSCKAKIFPTPGVEPGPAG